MYFAHFFLEHFIFTIIVMISTIVQFFAQFFFLWSSFFVLQMSKTFEITKIYIAFCRVAQFTGSFDRTILESSLWNLNFMSTEHSFEVCTCHISTATTCNILWNLNVISAEHSFEVYTCHVLVSLLLHATSMYKF